MKRRSQILVWLLGIGAAATVLLCESLFLGGPMYNRLEIISIKRSFLSDYEKGQKLMAFIRPGMTRDEVEKIVGEPSTITSRGAGGADHYYTEYGFFVSFDRKYRVIEVSKMPR
jgi:hypothetical protein